MYAKNKKILDVCVCIYIAVRFVKSNQHELIYLYNDT